MGSSANGCLSGLLYTSIFRASRMPPRGGQSGRNPATQFRIQFSILTVVGGFACTIVPSEIGSKIVFRNRIQHLIRPFYVLGRKIGRQIGHPIGPSGPVHSWVNNRAPSQARPSFVQELLLFGVGNDMVLGRARLFINASPNHMGMCSWYCALAVHCKLKRVVMLCSQSIRIILVSAFPVQEF